MNKLLIDELRVAASLRPLTDEARLMESAADELAQLEVQIGSLHRALELLSHEILDRCDKTLAAITRHLGPPPNP